ncbi:hypothetical protein GG804_27025 [Sphingomonas histidinilytica]|uniref:DUF2846 domain-containing protein n=1 Tax=Rhizorhabdus histidinilytica TaxID=439228 RepID=UPI001ADC9B4D|nr:DUF2846 domain-containing protein [Rhizorhabdus histidinilytica]MBO9380421.1 hypothetical protein [Rhizorhabdus histidinilytica]
MLGVLALLVQVVAAPVGMDAAMVPEAPVEGSAASAPSPTGKIIIYRPSSIMGAAIACPVRYKGRELVELGRGKYAEWEVPPGQYILTNKTASVQAIVQPGETAYVRCQIKTGFMTGRADLQIVDRESFAEHQADFERKEVAAVLDR